MPKISVRDFKMMCVGMAALCVVGVALSIRSAPTNAAKDSPEGRKWQAAPVVPLPVDTRPKMDLPATTAKAGSQAPSAASPTKARTAKYPPGSVGDIYHKKYGDITPLDEGTYQLQSAVQMYGVGQTIALEAGSFLVVGDVDRPGWYSVKAYDGNGATYTGSVRRDELDGHDPIFIPERRPPLMQETIEKAPPGRTYMNAEVREKSNKVLSDLANKGVIVSAAPSPSTSFVVNLAVGDAFYDLSYGDQQSVAWAVYCRYFTGNDDMEFVFLYDAETGNRVGGYGQLQEGLEYFNDEIPFPAKDQEHMRGR